MTKTVFSFCAAALIATTGAFGLSLTGWFSSKAAAAEAQVQASDPVHSDAAIRYRQNQNINWRCVMMIQE